MKYLLMRGRNKQSLALSVAALVASTQFLWGSVWEEGLSESEFCLPGMQMMTAISHLSLILKLANDISAAMGLDFWATVLGKL